MIVDRYLKSFIAFHNKLKEAALLSYIHIEVNVKAAQIYHILLTVLTRVHA